MGLKNERWVKPGYVQVCVGHIMARLEGDLSPNVADKLQKAVEGAVVHYCNDIIGGVLNDELKIAELKERVQKLEISRLEYRITSGVVNKTRELQNQVDEMEAAHDALSLKASRADKIGDVFDYFVRRAINNPQVERVLNNLEL